MKKNNIRIVKSWGKWLIPVAAVLLSACSMMPVEGTGPQYTSTYDRSTHQVNEFNVRSVTQAPEQITLMFRINVQPEEAFELVSDGEKLSTWFTDIKNPKTDNTQSSNGPNAMGQGSVRSCSLDDDYLYEDIVYYDNEKLAYAYVIDMERSTLSFPISNQLSMFMVEDDGQGGSLITWRHYFDKNFHIAAPVLNFMMKTMVLKPAVENLFEQRGGEWVKLKKA